jgi:hypothetical protein
MAASEQGKHRMSISLKRMSRRMGLGALFAIAGFLPLGQALAAPSFVSAPVYLRAFSPNGDGSQDSCRIELRVEGATAALDLIQLGLYSDTAVPPAPAALQAAPLPDSVSTSGLISRAYYTWHGRAGDDSAGQPVLADGFYYLHVLLREGADSLWLAPPIQLELNTAGPTLAAIALEPSPFFTPLQSEADTLLQLFFNSADFDTLTDQAWATVSREGEGGLYTPIAQIERDPHYFRLIDGLGRFRLLWDGRDGEAAIVDGNYRLSLRLEDDAGNPGAAGEADSNLDAKAPTFTLIDFGGPVEGGTNFTLQPDSLPDSLVVKLTDRNGIAACVGALDSTVVFDQSGRLLAQSLPGEHYYAFDLPAAWGAPGDPLGTHHFYLDGSDQAGNWRSDLSSVVNISINFDGEAPPVPSLDPMPGEFIQPVVTLSGGCGEFAVRIELAEDGSVFASAVTDLQGRFSLPVLLSVGSHVWTATSVDDAGNRSAPSAGLTLVYRPGPALRIPGRLRGDADEAFQINTRAPARAVVLRLYSLDGDLLRRLDAEGGPEQFSARWDLKDAGGREVMDGLCVLNLEIDYLSGERELERKVVAVVRATP